MRICAYCKQPAEGCCSIHRDGFGVGPEVDLCAACSHDSSLPATDIWDRIAHPAVGPFAHRRADAAAIAEAVALLTRLAWAMDTAHCYDADLRARYTAFLQRHGGTPDADL